MLQLINYKQNYYYNYVYLKNIFYFVHLYIKFIMDTNFSYICNIPIWLTIPHLEYKGNHQSIRSLSSGVWPEDILIFHNWWQRKKELYKRNNFNITQPQLITYLLNYSDETLWSDEDYVVLNNTIVRNMKNKKNKFIPNGLVDLTNNAELNDAKNIITKLKTGEIPRFHTSDSRLTMINFQPNYDYRTQAVLARVNAKKDKLTNDIYLFDLESDELVNDAKYDNIQVTIILYSKKYNIKLLVKKLTDDYSFESYETVQPEFMTNVEGQLLPHIEFTKFKNIDDTKLRTLDEYASAKDLAITPLDKNASVAQKKVRKDAIDKVTKWKLIETINRGKLIKNAGDSILIVKNIGKKSSTYHRFITNSLKEERDTAISTAQDYMDSLQIAFKGTASEDLYDSDLFSDYTITDTNSTVNIKVHRVILLLNGSEFFKSVLKSNFKESEENKLEIECQYPQNLEIVIKLVYGFENEFIDLIKNTIDYIIDFTQKNKGIPLSQWERLSEYPEYNNKIKIFTDLCELLDRLMLIDAKILIKNMILAHFNLLLVDMGQINLEIYRLAYLYFNDLLLDVFGNLEVYHYFNVQVQDEEIESKIESSKPKESKNDSSYDAKVGASLEDRLKYLVSL